MTRDKARKSAARNLKVQTGRPYVLSRRESAPTPDSTILCSDLSARIDRHLSRLGWTDAGNQTRSPSLGDMESWDWFPGPAHVLVGRDRGWFDGSGDPDDPDDYDISQVPTVTLIFRRYSPTSIQGSPTPRSPGTRPRNRSRPPFATLSTQAPQGLEALRIDAECAVCRVAGARHRAPACSRWITTGCSPRASTTWTSGVTPPNSCVAGSTLEPADSAIPNALTTPLAVCPPPFAMHSGAGQGIRALARRLHRPVGTLEPSGRHLQYGLPTVALPDALEMSGPGARTSARSSTRSGARQLHAAIVADMATSARYPSRPRTGSARRPDYGGR